jgi:hypothetical protein
MPLTRALKALFSFLLPLPYLYYNHILCMSPYTLVLQGSTCNSHPFKSTKTTDMILYMILYNSSPRKQENCTVTARTARNCHAVP